MTDAAQIDPRKAEYIRLRQSGLSQEQAVAKIKSDASSLTKADYLRMAAPALLGPVGAGVAAIDTIASKFGQSPLGESHIPEKAVEVAPDIARGVAKDVADFPLRAGAGPILGPALAYAGAKGSTKDRLTQAALSTLPGGAGSQAVRSIEQDLLGTRDQSTPDEDLRETGVDVALTAATTAIPVAAGAGARAVMKRISATPRLKGLEKFLRGAAAKAAGGDIAQEKRIAQEMFEEAKRLAGDTPVPVHNARAALAEMAKEAATPGSGGATAEAQIALDAAKELEKAGGEMTLGDLQTNLKVWGKRSQSWANEPAKKYVADTVVQGYKADLAALGSKELGAAADVLTSARASYARFKRAERLTSLIDEAIDPVSPDQLIDPRKFARMTGGEKGKELAKVFGDDAETKALWGRGVRVARELAVKDKSWIPSSITSPKAREMLRNFTRYGKIKKIMGDDDGARLFFDVVDPGKKMTEAQVMASLQALARIADGETADNAQTTTRPVAMKRGSDG